MSIIWQVSKDSNNALECSKYDECSKYLQEHRLTLAFEVVTSVLGDHGDNPKHPYLICEYKTLLSVLRLVINFIIAFSLYSSALRC